jgi:hypothetical protein
MAVIACGYCNETWEAALDEQWLCDCGVWGIGVTEYSPSELNDAFEYLATLRGSSPAELRDAIIPVAAAFQGTVNRFVQQDKGNSPPKFSALLDTLLLFFHQWRSATLIRLRSCSTSAAKVRGVSRRRRSANGEHLDPGPVCAGTGENQSSTRAMNCQFFRSGSPGELWASHPPKPPKRMEQVPSWKHRHLY